METGETATPSELPAAMEYCATPPAETIGVVLALANVSPPTAVVELADAVVAFAAVTSTLLMKLPVLPFAKTNTPRLADEPGSSVPMVQSTSPLTPLEGAEDA